MKTSFRLPIAVLVLLSSTQLFGASFGTSSRVVREFPVDPAGSVWIDNPFGSIDVIGGDGNVISVTADRIINAPDAAMMKEASESVAMSFEGDTKVRLIRTLLPPGRNARWNAVVNYVVRVPRSLNVKIGSKSAEHIRISYINGSVTVNGFSGILIMEGVVGASAVNMVNGRIIYDYTQKPVANAQIQSVNADVEMRLPAKSNFDWVANTITGDFLTNFDVRAGRFNGQVFHGVVGKGGPTINTEVLMARVMMLSKGSDASQAQSLRANAPDHARVPNDVLLQPKKKIQLPFVDGDFTFSASVADVTVGEVRGNVRVETGAGEVELGAVFGQCNVNSLGGPLNLGDVMGSLFAHTGAGDIIVRAARMGGQVTTEGGLIRVIYAGGPMTLRSGGGDIVVRQFSALMDAETTSGDITITGDPAQKSLPVTARTLQGNIVLNVTPRFAADIDATILTSDPDMNEMHIDFNG
ncbi:MAG: hypothetical protein QOE82_1651, partial [Thermoanaerobaculia bacterium]|nr:hypothetical protein [Thermoanaerobaculia bacterium]